MTQKSNIDALKEPRDDKYFVSLRASAQYIGVNTLPDVCSNVKLIGPGNNPITSAEKRTLSKTLAHMIEITGDGLVFIPLDMTTS